MTPPMQQPIQITVETNKKIDAFKQEIMASMLQYHKVNMDQLTLINKILKDNRESIAAWQANNLNKERRGKTEKIQPTDNI